MKLSAQKFQEALAPCLSLIEKRSIPAFSQVQVSAKRNSAVFTATDGTDWCRIILPTLEDTPPVQFALDAQALRALPALASSDTVELEPLTPETTRLHTGPITLTIPGIPFADCPEMPEYLKAAPHTVAIEDCGAFLTLMQKLLPFTTTPKERLAFSGVRVAPQGKELHLVSTDLHRVSVIISEQLGTASTAFTLSKAAVERLHALFRQQPFTACTLLNDAGGKEKDAPVYARITGENILYLTKLLPDEFPAYTQILDRTALQRSKTVVHKKELLKLLNTFGGLTKHMRVPPVVLELAGTELYVTLCNENEAAVVETSLVLNEPSADTLHLAVNARYLKEGLNGLGSTVKLAAREGLSPLYLMEEADNHTTYHLVMPLRFTLMQRAHKALAA